MTAPALSLVQRLTVAKVLTEILAALRTSEMIPAARRELESGERHAVKFGGKTAAWVAMPKPAQKSAYVKDPAALLAWTRKNYPEKLRDTVKIVAPQDELIVHLIEHWPGALETGSEPDPYWVDDLIKSLKKPGYYVTAAGERLTKDDIPGIELPEADDPTPTVTLTSEAQQIVAEAWRAGAIPVGDLLALPAAGPEVAS